MTDDPGEVPLSAEREQEISDAVFNAMWREAYNEGYRDGIHAMRPRETQDDGA